VTAISAFLTGPVERRKHRIEQLAQVAFGAVTAMLVLPVVAIFAYLLVKAWPALS